MRDHKFKKSWGSNAYNAKTKWRNEKIIGHCKCRKHIIGNECAGKLLRISTLLKFQLMKVERCINKKTLKHSSYAYAIAPHWDYFYVLRDRIASNEQATLYQSRSVQLETYAKVLSSRKYLQRYKENTDYRAICTIRNFNLFPNLSNCVKNVDMH